MLSVKITAAFLERLKLKILRYLWKKYKTENEFSKVGKDVMSNKVALTTEED